MKSAIFAVLAAFVAASAVSAQSLSEEQYQFLFTKWVQQHGKNYETTNALFSKFSTFKSNVDLIVAHNAQPRGTFKMAINQFADLNQQEFNQMMGLKTTKKVSPRRQTQQQTSPCQNSTVSKKVDVDWVAAGKVGPVKDQGSCGSCWAFSATTPIEAAWVIKGNQAVVLAEQQMVDCVTSAFDSSFISEGCDGGLMSEAMKYVSAVGQCAEADYKYTARDGTCKKCEKKVQPKGYREVHGIAEFKEEISNGPFSIGIAASSSAFQFYSSGIVTGCRDRSLNHGVVLVGLKSDDSTTDVNSNYMTIRNSWGASWGDKGHIKLSNVDNQCGVGTSPWDVAVEL